MEDDDQSSVHHRMTAALAELGFSNRPCRRTEILVHNGYCAGRQFIYDGVRVVWRIEEDVLEFHAEQGGLLRRVAWSGASTFQRRAA